MRAPTKKKRKPSKKSKTQKTEETKNIAGTVINSILDNVIKKEDLSDEDKAKAAYTTVVHTLQQFIALSSLQARILNETRALESALSKSNMKPEDFEIYVSAKAKSKKATKLTEEVKNAGSEDSGEAKEEQQESASQS